MHDQEPLVSLKSKVRAHWNSMMLELQEILMTTLNNVGYIDFLEDQKKRIWLVPKLYKFVDLYGLTSSILVS